MFWEILREQSRVLLLFFNCSNKNIGAKKVKFLESLNERHWDIPQFTSFKWPFYKLLSSFCTKIYIKTLLVSIVWIMNHHAANKINLCGVYFLSHFCCQHISFFFLFTIFQTYPTNNLPMSNDPHSHTFSSLIRHIRYT